MAQIPQQMPAASASGSLLFQSLKCSLSLDPRPSMASMLARLPAPPPMAVIGKQPIFRPPGISTLPAIKERRDRVGIAKATGESSEESSIIKSVQNVWDKSEDRIALFGLGFAGVVAFWASINLMATIDKLPIVPTVLELVGLLFSSWFTYRYLLFKPDRQELSQAISKSISEILGQ